MASPRRSGARSRPPIRLRRRGSSPPRRPDVEYAVEHGGDFFYLVTNDNARNFKIERAAERDGELAWSEVDASQRPGVHRRARCLREIAVVAERPTGCRSSASSTSRPTQSKDIGFPEESYGVRPSGNPEFKTDIYRFTYSSFITPSATFDYNVHDRRAIAEEAAGDPERIRCRRITRCIAAWPRRATACRCRSRS